MTERERLLKILNVPIFPHENVDPLEAVADYLLDNGVKIPVLCKDCKHWIGTGFGWGDCTNRRFHLDGHADPTMGAEEYCCLGEMEG